jgi:hypothetical protein
MANHCPKCPAESISGAHLSYSALDGVRAIRLLQLHPGKPTDDIECTIVYSSLNGGKGKQVRYTALSYVWGDQALPQPTILCNGALFHVTSNLEAALRTLRREDEQKILWVDQICINQTDLDERCSQVQIIGHIYKEADETIGWLGVASEDSSVAIASASTLKGRMEEILKELGDDPNQYFLKFAVPRPHAQGLFVLIGLGAANLEWISLMHLFEQPWFSRVWIIQEVMLSRKLILQWGSDDISWEEISELVETLEEKSNFVLKVKIFKSSSSQGALAMISKVAGFQKKDNIALKDLLGLSMAHHATDPRDRVYALLGLIKNSNRYGLIPNYKVPVCSVFHSVTRAIFAEEQSLRILVATHQSPLDQKLTDLASWCPDWSISERPLASRFMAGWGQFNADGGATINRGWDTDPTTLSLRGSIVDSLNDKRVYFDPPLADLFDETLEFELRNLQHHMHQLAILLVSCRQLNYQTTSQGEPTLEVAKNVSFWRAMVGGLDGSGKLATNVYSQYYEDYQEYVQCVGNCSIWDDINIFLESWSLERKRAVVWYSRCVLEAGNERQFIVTESGRLGWAPKWADSGDQVAILAGSRLPCVIRQCGKNRWKFIGSCYIDGIMLGEAISQGEYKEEGITLF